MNKALAGDLRRKSARGWRRLEEVDGRSDCVWFGLTEEEIAAGGTDMKFYDESIEISTDAWAEVLRQQRHPKERSEVLKLIYESRDREIMHQILQKLNLSHHATLNLQIPPANG